MVAKIEIGAMIRGAVSYNENKVNDGKAELLSAINYPKEGAELTFNERLGVLRNQALLRPNVKQKCLHISLNFEPTEDLSNETMRAIAEEYMLQIGFGEQPYLVYRHYDAAHSHMHIVTTSIQANGHQIRLHNIAKEKSSPARLNIEKQFRLIPAQRDREKESFVLRPADLEKALYGKSETKLTISNIVRSVYQNYRFTSLAEFNAVLGQFNVTAYQGEPGMKMYENGGLVYSLIDPTGKRVGVPIKASSIYDSPKLSRLKEKFSGNIERRKDYKARLIRVVEDILDHGVSFEELLMQLQEKQICLVPRRNAEGRIYGLTYVDNLTRCVFNGSDLGKAFTPNGILSRTDADLQLQTTRDSRNFCESVLNRTNFTAGIKHVLCEWAASQVIVSARETEENGLIYFMGGIEQTPETFWRLPARMQSYFLANQLSTRVTSLLEENVKEYFFSNLEKQFTDKAHTELTGIIEHCFDAVPVSNYISHELLKEAKKKRRRRSG